MMLLLSCRKAIERANSGYNVRVVPGDLAVPIWMVVPSPGVLNRHRPAMIYGPFVLFPAGRAGASAGTIWNESPVLSG
jgi:hypothetical protein